MSTVCAPSLFGGLVDLDVLDDQSLGIKTLSVGVGLSVLEEAEKEFGGLDGPAGLGDAELLSCSHYISLLFSYWQFLPFEIFPWVRFRFSLFVCMLYEVQLTLCTSTG